jgi:tetratricopeptide (TPR) repeat protein
VAVLFAAFGYELYRRNPAGPPVEDRADPLELARSQALHRRDWALLKETSLRLREGRPTDPSIGRHIQMAEGWLSYERSMREGMLDQAQQTLDQRVAPWIRPSDRLEGALPDACDRIARERLAEEALHEVEAALERGVLEGAEDRLKQVSAQSVFRPRVEQLAARLRERAVRVYGEGFDAHLQDGRWEEASGALEALRPLVPSEEGEALARLLVQERESARVIEQVQALAGRYELQEARLLLAGIPEGSRRYGEAKRWESLLAEMEVHREALREVDRLFAEGAGEGALELLARCGASDPSAGQAGETVVGILRQRRELIHATLRLHEQALQSMNRADASEAAGHLESLVALQLPPGNWYGDQAREALAALRHLTEGVVADLLQEGQGAVEGARWEEALALFRQVLQVDPDNGEATSFLERIYQEGERRYEAGYVLRQIAPRKALEHWQGALRLLSQEHPYHRKIRDQIEQLAAEVR